MSDWEIAFSHWLNTTFPGMCVGVLLIMVIVCLPAAMILFYLAKVKGK
jgi:hypothetical protein